MIECLHGKPKMALTKRFTCVLLIGIGVMLTACGDAPDEPPPPQEIVLRSAERMKTVRGFEFVIDRSGAPVFLDYDETISFRRAEGRFNAPDQVSSSVRIIAPGIVAEARIISMAGLQWETNLLTGEWQASDPVYSFNTTRLFDPQTGIPAILANDLAALALNGLEELPEVPGKELYVLEASLQGEHAYEMTYGMIDNDPLEIKLWIAPDSFDLYRVLLTDPANPGDEEDTIWQIDFWNFDRTFEIEQPPLTTE